MSWQALALILLAFVFLLVDLKVTSHGLPTAAAILALTLGGLAMSGVMAPYPWASSAIVGVVSISAAATLLVIAREARAARDRPALTGAEGMIGEVGTVRRSIGADSPGWVFVHGELWRAVAAITPEDAYDGGSDPIMGVGRKVMVVDISDGKVAVAPFDRYPNPDQTGSARATENA